MDTKLVKPDGFIKPGAPVKPDVPPKTSVPGKAAVPGKPGLPVRPESPQKAAFDSQSTRPSSSAIPLLNAAANLGFPKDALSAALLVFTRFFYLSADKALIGSLRREILDMQKTSSPGTAEEKAALEARAMAAVIAADKGVLLSPMALERYARFLMPALFMATSSMTKASVDKENQSPKADMASQDSREKSPGNSRRETLEDTPEPDVLKAIAETQTREDGFLDFLNYLPGKNGQYWLVFPFDVNIKGIELRVLLRVLRNDNGANPGLPSASEDGQLIADISGPKRQWRCFAKKTAGKFRADIQIYPEYSQIALNHLRKQAERFLGKGGGLPTALSQTAKVPRLTNTKDFSGFEEIIVRNGDRIPLWSDDLWPNHLSFVDEEV